MTAWYAGREEGSEDSVILGSRLKAGNDRWEPFSVLVNVAGHAAGNPRIFVGPDEAVWLLAPVNYGRWCQGGTYLFLKRTYDDGCTWTDLEFFIKRKGILGKNKPLHLKTRPEVWIIPAEYEKKWVATFVCSHDGGKKWKIYGDIGERERLLLDQPTIVELSDGSILAYMRSWEGWIYKSCSHDGGKSWSFATKTSLPNNNSAIDMVKLDSGELVLAFNPTGLGEDGKQSVGQSSKNIRNVDTGKLDKESHKQLLRVIRKLSPSHQDNSGLYPPWGPRTPLSLAVSKDEGESWQLVMDLENQEGEYSYPAIIQDKNKRIHIVYTYNRLAIKHVCLGVDDILKFNFHKQMARRI